VVAAMNTDGKSDLWQFDSQHKEGIRLTYSGIVWGPIWAPDGRAVYCRQIGSFTPLMFRVDSPDVKQKQVGSAFRSWYEMRQLDLGASFRDFQCISRNGEDVVFTTLGGQVWTQRLVDGGERRPLVQEEFSADQARLSPDGRWLAFTLWLPTGPAVFVKRVDQPRERIQVSPERGFGPIWRDDARELFYEAPDGFMAVAMNENQGSLSIGEPQRLFSLHTAGFTLNQPYNVYAAGDGQKFLVNTVVNNTDNVPLEVTLNWARDIEQ